MFWKWLRSLKLFTNVLEEKNCQFRKKKLLDSSQSILEDELSLALGKPIAEVKELIQSLLMN